jgi:hypothetical protein
MFKKLTTYSLAAFMFGAGSVAVAHTGVKDAAIEGKSLYTAFTIGHGCGGTAVDPITHSAMPPLPVIAQSVLFPNNVDSVWSKITADPDGTGPLTATETPISIDQAVEGALPDTPLVITPNLVQDVNVFKKQREIADTSVLLGAHATPNVRAFNLTNGHLQTDLVGLVPFSVAGVGIKIDSCVKSIKVRIAIANWCKTGRGNMDDNRADFWLGAATSKFSNPAVVSLATATSTAYWPTLTINRDLVAHPYPASCNGVGYDVAVQPSAADIDKYLPIAGFPLGK